MVAMPRNPLALIAAALALSSVAAAADVTSRSNQPISLDAASSDVDYKSNMVVFRDVVISQGDVRVSAERAQATGLDFENSTWTFSGNVQMKVEGGSLNSSEAKIDFRNNRISRATISGSPARFEQQLANSSTTANGRASSIVYDLTSSTVKLANDAWLSDGRNEIRGEELVYNLQEQRVQAQARPGQNDRVRITIHPQDKKEPKP